MLMLTPDTIQVLGGQVEELIAAASLVRERATKRSVFPPLFSFVIYEWAPDEPCHYASKIVSCLQSG
jgi:hypothetical protein